MTEFDIQEKLFDTFCTLNDFSQLPFLVIDDTKEGYEKYTNAHFPNVPFEVPDDKRWFDLTFRNNEPEDAAIMEGSQARFTGLLYIDIITPQDSFEDEAKNKFKWISKLFNSVDIDVIDIMRVYIANKGNEADHYRTLAAVEWEADIDKE